MGTEMPLSTPRDAEPSGREAAGAPYVLRLYVAGMNRRSSLAVENVRAVCDEHLRGRFDLEVIDVYQQPALAVADQIVAAPTLIRKLPLPLRRMIGDMSSRERLLRGLDLETAK